jgi:nucleoside-diphosphate-sugar epimerase
MRILITGGSGFIGTNLIDLLELEHNSILNVDKSEPYKKSHYTYWCECNILEYDKMFKIIAEYKPDYVIHLAARTDTDSNILEDYRENTEGTRNLIGTIKEVKSVQRLIITSTQFVNQYHGMPKHDEDYAPHTTYGESKMINEKDLRAANLSCAWTIIRPTNVWGPWHKRYPFEFWKILAENKYIHPGRRKIIRSYGYVGNVCWQILKILSAPVELVNRKVYYVGDYPIELFDWVNQFSKKQIGRNVKVVPAVIVKSLAIIGEGLKMFRIKFPITLSRYKSMTSSNDAPMKHTFETFGNPPYSLESGVEETVNWMKINHPNLVKLR